MNLIDDSNLITIPRYMINKICQGRLRCPINIEIINNHDYIFFIIFNNGKKFERCSKIIKEWCSK